MDSDFNFGYCQNPDAKCGFWHQKSDVGTDFGSGKWISKIAFGMQKMDFGFRKWISKIAFGMQKWILDFENGSQIFML